MVTGISQLLSCAQEWFGRVLVKEKNHIRDCSNSLKLQTIKFQSLGVHPDSISFVNVGIIYQFDFHCVCFFSVSKSLHKPLRETRPSRRDEHLTVSIGRLKMLLLELDCSGLVLCMVNTSDRQLSLYWCDCDVTGEWEMGSPNHCRYAAGGSQATVLENKCRVCYMQDLELPPLSKWWRESPVCLSPKEALYEEVKKKGCLIWFHFAV